MSISKEQASECAGMARAALQYWMAEDRDALRAEMARILDSGPNVLGVVAQAWVELMMEAGATIPGAVGFLLLDESGNPSEPERWANDFTQAYAAGERVRVRDLWNAMVVQGPQVVADNVLALLDATAAVVESAARVSQMIREDPRCSAHLN